MEIRNRLASLIAKKGIKQKEVAEYCGVSRSTIAKWLQGSMVPARGMNLIRLAEVLDTTEVYIVYGTDTFSTEGEVTSDEINRKLSLLSARQAGLVEEMIDCLIEPLTREVEQHEKK